MVAWLFKSSVKKIHAASLYRRLAGRLATWIHFDEASPQDLITVHRAFTVGVEASPAGNGRDTTNYVARMRGLVAGFVQLKRYSSETFPFQGFWLLSLQVRPLWRGMGIGEGLTRKVVERAAAERAQELLLLVEEDNWPAINLYDKLGFKRIVIPRLEEQLEEEQLSSGKRRISLRKALV